MSPSTSRLFILDLDGTLVDSAPDIGRALGKTLSEAGFPVPTPAEVIGYIGDGATRLVERALPGDATADVPALVERFKRHYAGAVCVDSRPYDRVLETLRLLGRRGVRHAVLTNKPSELARALLHELGFNPLIADVIGDGDGFPRKPAPNAARYLLERHEMEANQAWVIGDALPDVRLGQAVGCRVAAASWGYTSRAVLAAAKPDRILDSPAEMLTLLERPTLLP